jgi:hypothetical protein
MHDNIVACSLKTRIVNPEGMAVARKLPINMFPWQHMHTITELLTLVFRIGSMPRLYKYTRQLIPASMFNSFCPHWVRTQDHNYCLFFTATMTVHSLTIPGSHIGCQEPGIASEGTIMVAVGQELGIASEGTVMVAVENGWMG